MKKFLYNFFFAIIPFLIYVFLIMVFRPYFIKKQYFQNNRSDLLIKHLQKFKRKSFDTFILGNSRSQMLKAKKFQNQNHSGFHFDNPGGNLYHFQNSLEYLAYNFDFQNVILFLDSQSIVYNESENTYHSSLSPIITGDYLNFYSNYIKLFFNYRFVISIILKEFDFEIPKYFRGYVLDWADYNSTSKLTGDIEFNIDKLIRANKNEFFNSQKYKSRFENNYKNVSINNNELTLKNLKIIKEILDTNKVNYVIVIPPVYNNISTSANDAELIKKTFNNINVLDFSNNPTYYLDINNFKDYSHFNNHFGDFIYSKIQLRKPQISH